MGKYPDRRSRIWRHASAIVILVLTVGAPAVAQESGPDIAPPEAPAKSDDGILTFQFENDFFGNKDRHFTHGTRIAWMSAEDDVPEWIREASRHVPIFDAEASRRIVWSLSQSMFTPQEIEREELITDDRPYAGWLHTGVGLVSVSGNRLDNLQLDLGVVGPWSFAEDMQRAWHKVFGFRKPRGWDNQLENEPGVVLTYERAWRNWVSIPFIGLDGDFSPHLGASVGNVLTQGAAGFMLRIGDDLHEYYDYGPPRIRPSLPGSDYFVAREEFGWYLFFGVEGRAVARNIFLDGNTFADSHSVDKKHFVADFQAGIALIFGRARLAYTHVLRTEEFEEQDAPDKFGSVSLSIQF